jgi:YVTN family beta-propeller protein
MALVVNQDDTSMTTLRLDGQGSPVISTLSLGPTQSDEIGGVSFSIGEWIFVTHKAGNRVAFIDPIGAPAPILEGFLEVNGPVRIGQRPSRIYRDPVDKEVLWTMNEGDPSTGIDTVRPCPAGSISVVHNSHLSVGGTTPHVSTTTCVSGVGEHFIAFSRLPAVTQEIAFVSSKTTGLISLLLADPSFGDVRWGELQFLKIDLCDSTKEISLGYPPCDGNVTTPNHSAPSGMFWSQATGKIYSYLSGYQTVVEVDPNTTFTITRKADITPPVNTALPDVGITPDGRFLFLTGEDVISDASKVIGKIGIVDLTAANPGLTVFSIPQLDNLRPAQFRFTPDGKRLYLTQSNSLTGLATLPQVQNLIKDVLLVFDPSPLPLAPTFLTQIPLPPSDAHGMDVWVTGPQGAGSAKGIVVTNATSGAAGTVSLIDAATNIITSTIAVGRNPKQVTVYYYGLAASDNQATPVW